jgi:hypothetical protein
MSKPLDDATLKIVRDWLYTRYTMPHSVCSACLEKIGIFISPGYVRSIRNRFEIKYEKDARIHNAVQFAKSHDIEITHEYLLKKCPDICVEHRVYLIELNAKKVRKELPPVRVGGIAHVVHQILLAA